MGYCGKHSGVRGSALLARREGENKKLVTVLVNAGELWSTFINSFVLKWHKETDNQANAAY